MHSTIILTKGVRPGTLFLMAGLILFSMGCGKRRPPENVLSEQQLSSFLIDVYIAEAKLTPLRTNRDSGYRLFKPYETSLLEAHKISRAKLKESYRYYLDHPLEFEKVYEVVMDTLSLREKRAEQASKKKQ